MIHCRCPLSAKNGHQEHPLSWDHLLLGKCDPRKWPEEINRQNRDTLPLRPSLWCAAARKYCDLVAHFWASPGLCREDQERAGRIATVWLCWETAANESLQP